MAVGKYPGLSRADSSQATGQMRLEMAGRSKNNQSQMQGSKVKRDVYNVDAAREGMQELNPLVPHTSLINPNGKYYSNEKIREDERRRSGKQSKTKRHVDVGDANGLQVLKQQSSNAMM